MTDYIEDQLSQVEAVMKLGSRLTLDDVTKFISYLNLPASMFQGVLDGFMFLSQFQECTERDPKDFFYALNQIRPDLVGIANEIGWLTTVSPSTQLSPIKYLARILKTEIEREHWSVIDMSIPAVKKATLIEDKIRALITAGYISKDLNNLRRLMENIQRNDIACKIQRLESSFKHYSVPFFIARFEKALDSQVEDLENWEEHLKKHVVKQNKRVQQMLENDKFVDIESIYVPLTIIEGESRPVDQNEETTYNEIEYLRQISEQQFHLTSIDFNTELEEYTTTEPEIWCLIGNPGSGKTFLCHRTALKFGMGELSQFRFAICIPCRHPEWHYMESTRIHQNLPIDSDFIQNWLFLGMPEGCKWVPDLAEYMIETHGQDLLMVIDSIDEFIRDVPFDQTILYLLLTRDLFKKSTIIVTSRPGAYSNISSSHSLQISRIYQVLGFSPENRDLYFRMQLKGVDKMKEWRRLIYLHDEIDQLSLIPVNASLFATLVRDSDKVSAQTLTHLYSQLNVYLIKRQLVRMDLEDYVNRTLSLSQLHPDVEDCLKRIGEMAYLGLYSRTLIVSKSVNLRVGLEEKSCQCLGLVSEYIQKESVGGLMVVSSFPHLTIQEFVGSYWLSVSSWRDQCLSVRYIVNTNDNFSIFKMMVRFLCGLLVDRSEAVFCILYKFLPPRTIPLEDMPMCYQLDFPISEDDPYYNPLVSLMGWTEFTVTYLTLSALLYECNSQLIWKAFSIFNQFLPKHLFFYFNSILAPNEWECFVRSLELLKSIHTISLDTSHVTPLQFQLLLPQLTACSVTCLALKIHDQSYSTVSRYCNLISCYLSSKELKLSFDISNCLFNAADADAFNSILPHISSLRLNTQLPTERLVERGLSLKNLYICQSSSPSDILLLLPQNWKLLFTGLHIMNAESGYILYKNFNTFSNLSEITLEGNPHFLKRILKSYQYTYLSLRYYLNPSEYELASEDLFSPTIHILNVIIRSGLALRGLKLGISNTLELYSMDKFLKYLAYCTNLVDLKLGYCEVETGDDTLWCGLSNRLKRLVYLKLERVRDYATQGCSNCVEVSCTILTSQS